MMKEFNTIGKFGAKSRNPAVQNNITRGVEMGVELLRKYSSLVQQRETYASNAADFQKLKGEYESSTATYAELATHLEGLVGRLVEENKALKHAHKTNNLELPATK